MMNKIENYDRPEKETAGFFAGFVKNDKNAETQCYQ